LDLEYKDELTYKLVGSTETDSLHGKISNESPVGHALIGHVAGDTVEVETEAGTFQYKILEASRA
jgi:transcription elongation factor GreA